MSNTSFDKNSPKGVDTILYPTMKSSSFESSDEGCEIQYDHEDDNDLSRNTNNQSNNLDESYDGDRSDKPINNKYRNSSSNSTDQNYNNGKKMNRYPSRIRSSTQSSGGIGGGGFSPLAGRPPLLHTPSQNQRRTRRGLFVTCIFMTLMIVIVASVSYVFINKNRNSNSSATDNNNNGQSNTSDESQQSGVDTTDIPTASPTIEGYMQCNGLENLCDVPVNDVYFATVHNAGSTKEDGVIIVPNHEYSYYKALQAGYRGINFDIGKCGDGTIQFIHGTCLLGTLNPIDVFKEIITFLREYPHEVLLMPIQIENEAEGGIVTIDEIYQELKSVDGLLDLLYTAPPIANATTTNVTSNSNSRSLQVATEWPTLRQLIEQDKRIILMHYGASQRCSNLTTGICPSGMNEWFQYAAETQFQFDSINEMKNSTYSCELTRGYTNKRNESNFIGVNVFLEIPSETNCFITNKKDFLLNHLKQCTNINAGRSPNVVLVDCWNIGNVLEVIQIMNEELNPNNYDNNKDSSSAIQTQDTAKPASAATNETKPTASPIAKEIEDGESTDVPSTSLTSEDVAAELFLLFGNVSSEITDDNNFEILCTTYFSQELNSTWNDIQCSILAQSLTSSSSSNRKLKRRPERRQQEDVASLQVILQVTGQPKRTEAVTNSTLLSSLLLKTIVDESGNELLNDLKSSTSNRTKRTFIPALNISATDVSEGSTIAPTTITTFEPTASPVMTFGPTAIKLTLGPTIAQTTTSPSLSPSSILEPTIAPIIIPPFSQTVCSIERQQSLQLVSQDDAVLSLKFFTNAIDNTITVQMIYSGIGWIGISFVETNKMIPAISIIGLPNDQSVNKYLMLSKALSGISSDGIGQTLMDSSIGQNSTHTIMTFTKYLSESDDINAIPLAGMIIVNYAIGCSNDLSEAGHCLRGSGSFENAGPCSDDFTDANTPVTSPSPSAIATRKSRTTDSTLVCNGLQSLCDVPVHKVMFASIHNAQASAEDGFLLSPNHQKNLDSALTAGYRSINMDFGICNGSLQLVHSYCLLGTKDPFATFSDIVSFLNNNPDEVLLLTIQIDNELEGEVTNDMIDSVFMSIPELYSMMYQHPNKDTEWPTLRTLIESNRRILYFQYNSNVPCTDTNTGEPNGQCPYGFHDWFVYAVENQYVFDTVSYITNDVSYSCELTRGDASLDSITTENGRRPNIFFGLNVFTSIPTQENCAVTNQNQFLLNFMTACKDHNSNLQPNVVFVDCWDVGDLLNVTQAYNANLS